MSRCSILDNDSQSLLKHSRATVCSGEQVVLLDYLANIFRVGGKDQLVGTIGILEFPDYRPMKAAHQGGDHVAT